MKGKTKKRLKIFGGVFLTLVIIGSIQSAFEDPEQESAIEAEEVEAKEVVESDPPKEEKAEEPKEEEQPLSKDEELKKKVTKILGKETNNDMKTIEEISLNSIGNVVMTLNGNDNFTNNMIKTSLQMDTVEILEALKDEEFELILITWQLPLVDAYGEVEQGHVLRYTFDKETVSKINFDNFSRDNLERLAQDYYEHANVF